MHQYSKHAGISYRTYVLRAVALGFAGLIFVKLFYLQVLRNDHYRAMANAQHKSEIVLRAKRGDILVKDVMGQYATLATDVALTTIYFDPAMIEPADEQMIADYLGPLLFEPPTNAEQIEEQAAADLRIAEARVELEATSASGAEASPVSAESAKPRESYETMLETYKHDLIAMMQRKEVNHVSLISKPSEAVASDIESLNLRGIFVTMDEVYADPTIIREGDLERIASKLSQILDESAGDLEYNLRRRDIRYIPIKKAVSPAIADQIKETDLPGVGVIPEYQRYYPERSLASSVIGFINKEGVAQYGVEEQFDDPLQETSLQGIDGKILIDRDPRGRQIAVGDVIPEPAVDGDSIVLTIDRVIQARVEKILNRSVDNFRAESGSVVIMDPKTGAIVAMATYPGFDPNEYWKALEKNEGGVEAGQYKNKVGVKAFKNPTIDEVYEPGSIFKIITMASGIDAGEVEPDTVHCQRTAVIYRDNYPIRNSDLLGHGCISMAKVLEKSSNLGALWVAEKLGRTLFHKYIVEFGFGDLTDFDLQQEQPGWLRKPHNWADVDLAAAGFGQGLAVTPLQMVTATTAIANGGKLLRPYVVAEIIDSTTGKTIVNKPQIIRNVISPDTASKVAAMMVGVVDGAFGQKIRINGYDVAGKSGTAQIAKGGGYEKGEGSTIASFVGFLPAENPKFVMITRVDRPRSSPWSEGTAAPLWKEVAEMLIEYYGIEPTE